MVKTTKTSIAAITFVTIYFIFIIFISLFKGITLYDIKTNRFYVHKIFIKLNKKITLKINNLKIFTFNNYNKEALQLHKIFYYSTKLLPIFKEISINKIYINNNLIIKKIVLYKKQFSINSPQISLKGSFKIYKNYSSIFLNYVKYKKYTLKDTYILSYYTKKYVFSNIKAFYNKNPIYLALKADNKFIYYSLNIPKINFNYYQNNIKLNKLNILGKIDTLFIYNQAKLNAKSLNFKNQKIILFSKKINGILKNKLINIKTPYTQIKLKPYIKKLNLNHSFFTIDLKNKSLTSGSKEISLYYDKYKLKAQNITFNYYLKNNNFFLHALNIKFNNDINGTTQELIVSKLPNFYFYLKDNNIKYKLFNLKNNFIKGNKKLIILSDIIGKIIGFNSKIKTPIINLKQKYAFSKKIIFNNINFFNTTFSFVKKPYVLSSYTNTLFNKNILSILKKYKINIPIIQIKGKNTLKFKVLINNKLDNIIYDLNSSNSLFKYQDINISYQNLKIKGDLNYSNIDIKKLSIPYNIISSLLDANTTINIPQKYLNSYIFIHKLNIGNYLNIKNFYEKLALDLQKKYVFLLNSYIFINLNNKTIYFYSIKNLLRYTIFNEIFKSGEIIIKLLNNKIDIFANTIIKYPLILNQKNPNHIKANIEIKNNNIFIKNKFIISKILNFNKIYTYIHNIDIDLEGLIKITNTVQKVINQIKKTPSKKNNLIQVVITSRNTNFIYKNHKFLTDKANLIFDKEIKFNAQYKHSYLKGYTKNGYLLIEGKNYNKKALVPLLNFFNHFNYINLDFILVRSPADFYTGKIYIKKGSVKDLATLNNIIAFINTIPALLSLNNPGFSAKGYKIKNGYISFLFYNDILYFKQIKIKGTNIDLYGKGYVNLKKNYIKMKIQSIIKIKIKKIPIIGKALSYILFGKDGYLHVNIFVRGNLNNPKISKDMGGGIIETPLKLFKRILTLPFNLF